MSYSAAPTVSTDQNKTVNLFYGWDIRGDGTGSKDTVFKNALVEPIESKDYVQILKRDGVETLPLSTPIDGYILGVYYWPAYFVICIVSKDRVGIGGRIQLFDCSSFALLNTFTSAFISVGEEECAFQEFLYQNGTIDLMIMAHNTLYRIVGGTFAFSTITTSTATPANCLAYLDGYLVINDKNNIYTSQLNDPTTWPAPNFIAADSYSDVLVRIARVGPYIAAFGTESIQYFFDAANPTGTPLGANVGATKRIGYVGGYANYGDDILFVGTSNNSVQSLYRLSGLKCEAIPSTQFTRAWTANANTSASAPVSHQGSILNLAGHDCYFCRTSSTFFVQNPPALTGVSYVYDLDNGTWSKLGYQAQDFYLIMSSTTYSPAQSSVGPSVPRMTYFSVLGDGNLYRFNPNIYQDNGVNFEVKFRTHALTWGTSRHKFGSKLTVLGDMTPSTSFLNVSWSDDDYQTFSAPRPVDMSMQYQQLWSLGKFRKRGWQFSYSDNFPMRWQSFELDYQQGSD